MLRSSSAHRCTRENRLRRPVAGERTAGRHRAGPRPAARGSHRTSSTDPRPHLGAGLATVTVATVLSVFLGLGTGWAYWTATATGLGLAASGTLTAPTDVAAEVGSGSAGTIPVSWSASVVDGGAPDHGYHVVRIDAATDDASPACGTSTSAPVHVLTCEDQPPDGTYRYRVTAVHHSWTAVSGPSGTVSVDATAPAAPSAPDLVASSDSGASDSDDLTNDATATFIGTAEVGSTVRLYSDAALVGSGVATDGAWSITTEAALPEGSNMLTARATDAAGNTSVDSAANVVTIDTVAPTVFVSRAPAQEEETSAQPVAFSVTFAEAVTGFEPADVQLTAPAGATVAVTGSGADYRVEVGGMTADGTVTVSVGATAARDAAGNGNTQAPADSSVVLDSTAPTAPGAPALDPASDTGSSSTDGITSDTTPTFTGSAEPGSTVALFEGATALGWTVAGSDGAWSISSSVLAEGVHSLAVTATDAAGNTSEPSGSTTVTIDTAAPDSPSAPDLAAASDSYSVGYNGSGGSTDSDDYTNDTTALFTGTAQPGLTVTLHRDGGTTIGQGIADDGGSYAIQMPTEHALAHGLHTVTAVASDLSGNAAASPSGLTVTVDTAAPAVSVTSTSFSVRTAEGLADHYRAHFGGGLGVHAYDGLLSVQLCTTTTCETAVPGPEVQLAGSTWSRSSDEVFECVGLMGERVCSGTDLVHARVTQTDRAGNVAVVAASVDFP